MAERQHERFLSDVPGLVQVAAQADRGADRDVLEAVDDRRPRTGVTLLGGAD